LTRLLDDCLLVDVILLDQAKPFDKVQYQLLALKLKAYEVHTNIIDFIEVFSTDRTQRVMMCSYNSNVVLCKLQPVKSRVPHGTILGLALLSMYINYCTTYLKDPLTLYTDDCKLIGLTQDNINQAGIEEELNQLLERSFALLSRNQSLKRSLRYEIYIY